MMTIDLIALVQAFLLLVTATLLGMAAVTWRRRRRTPEAPLLTLLLMATAIYTLGYSQEVAQDTLASARFWLHVEYLGVSWVPSLWALLARQHAGRRRCVWPFLLVPPITALGEWTNSLHGWFNYSMVLLPHNPFWVVHTRRGPLAWLNLLYLYLTILYGAWLFLRRFHTASSLLRRPNLLAILAPAPPLLGYLIYALGWSPWGLDLAPPTMALTAVMAYLVVFQLELFDMVPMARSLVFNSMRDAALVTDLNHRLVEFNHASREILPSLGPTSLGRSLPEVFRELPALADALADPQTLQNAVPQRRVEIVLPQQGRQSLEVRAFPLGQEKHPVGWAVILANVTAQMQLLREMKQRADTDALTGVANRGCFTACLEREWARAQRSRSAFSVALIDVDYFKAINDRMGHGAGDKVLCTIAQRIGAALRAADLLGRYGGDEFVVLLPGLEAKDAHLVAERIRRTLTAPVPLDEQQMLPITLSLGLATHTVGDEADWKQLLQRADQALYQAKKQGRNCAVQWTPQP